MDSFADAIFAEPPIGSLSTAEPIEPPAGDPVTTPPAPSPTDLALAEMLLADTGASMLDSGGAYGRAWQHARAHYLGRDSGLPNREFDGGPSAHGSPTAADYARAAAEMIAEPRATIDDYGDVSLSTFHWLRDRLDYEPRLDRAFLRWSHFADRADNRANGLDPADKYGGRSWLDLANSFIALVANNRRYGGAWSDGGRHTAENVYSDNSYNYENRLDRTLQYSTAGGYAAIQLHGGADVRGGYTRPYIFSADSYGGAGADEFVGLYDFAGAEIYCNGSPTPPAPSQCNGQISLDGEIYSAPSPAEIRPHVWSSSYDGWRFRRADDGADWPAEPAGERAIGELEPETGAARHGWSEPIALFLATWPIGEDSERSTYDRRDMAGADVARRVAIYPAPSLEPGAEPSRPIFGEPIAELEPIGYQWQCPIDGSPLAAEPAL